MKKYFNYMKFQDLLTLDVKFYPFIIIPVIIGFATIQTPAKADSLGLSYFTYAIIFVLIGLHNKYVYVPTSYLYPMTSKEHSKYIIFKSIFYSLIYMALITIYPLIYSLIFREELDLMRNFSYKLVYDYLFAMLLFFILSPLAVIRNKVKWTLWLFIGNTIYFISRTIINYLLTDSWAFKFQLSNALRSPKGLSALSLTMITAYTVFTGYLGYLANERILKTYLGPKKA